MRRALNISPFPPSLISQRRLFGLKSLLIYFAVQACRLLRLSASEKSLVGQVKRPTLQHNDKFRGVSWRRRCFDPEAEAQELQEQVSEGRGEAPTEAVAAASPSSASSQGATQEREAAPESLILTTYYREVTDQGRLSLGFNYCFSEERQVNIPKLQIPETTFL